MKEPIRNGKLEIIGYHEQWSPTREFLYDKNGRKIGVFEADTHVTRDKAGKIVGRGANQLFRLLRG